MILKLTLLKLMENKQTALVLLGNPSYLTNYFIQYFSNNDIEYRNYYNEDMYIYILYNKYTKLTKIGITGNYHNRLKNLNNVSGIKLEFVMLWRFNADIDYNGGLIEKLLHQFFNIKRKIGEWFDLKHRDLLAIRSLFYYLDAEEIVENTKDYYHIYKGNG